MELRPQALAGSFSVQQAVERQSMPPPAGRLHDSNILINKKRKHWDAPQLKVLEEEEYVDALAAIIERDYFPHIADMRNKLQALETVSKDLNRTARESITSQAKVKHQSYTYLQAIAPSNANEPGVNDGIIRSQDVRDEEARVVTTGSGGAERKVNKTQDLSVDEFFRRFTSFDNASFDQLQQLAVDEHRRKFHWAYDEEDQPQSDDDEVEDQEGGSDGTGTGNRRKMKPRRRPGMLMLYYLGDGADGRKLSVAERAHMDSLLNSERTRAGFSDYDNRPNGADQWRFRVRNQFMFPPQLRDSQDTCRMNDPLLLLPPAPLQTAESQLLMDAQQPQQLNARPSLTNMQSQVKNDRHVSSSQLAVAITTSGVSSASSTDRSRGSAVAQPLHTASKPQFSTSSSSSSSSLALSLAAAAQDKLISKTSSVHQQAASSIDLQRDLHQQQHQHCDEDGRVFDSRRRSALPLPAGAESSGLLAGATAVTLRAAIQRTATGEVTQYNPSLSNSLSVLSAASRENAAKAANGSSAGSRSDNVKLRLQSGEKVIQRRNTSLPSSLPLPMLMGDSAGAAGELALTSEALRWLSGTETGASVGARAWPRGQAVPGSPLEAPHSPSMFSSAASSKGGAHGSADPAGGRGGGGGSGGGISGEPVGDSLMAGSIANSTTSSQVGDALDPTVYSGFVPGLVPSRRKEYAAVPMSPMPVPGHGALRSLSPLVTWGQLDGSPLWIQEDRDDDVGGQSDGSGDSEGIGGGDDDGSDADGGHGAEIDSKRRRISRRRGSSGPFGAIASVAPPSAASTADVLKATQTAQRLREEDQRCLLAAVLKQQQTEAFAAEQAGLPTFSLQPASRREMLARALDKAANNVASSSSSSSSTRRSSGRVYESSQGKLGKCNSFPSSRGKCSAGQFQHPFSNSSREVRSVGSVVRKNTLNTPILPRYSPALSSSRRTSSSSSSSSSTPCSAAAAVTAGAAVGGAGRVVRARETKVSSSSLATHTRRSSGSGRASSIAQRLSKLTPAAQALAAKINGNLER